MAARPVRRDRGFTLIELMVAVAIVAVIAGVAIPSYTSYVARSKVPPALDGLSAYATRMEQRYQDVGSYADSGGNCAVSVPAVSNFTISCTIIADSSGQSYTATATGSGSMAGYAYTINQAGVRRTTAHPKGPPTTDCWSTRGKTCDT